MDGRDVLHYARGLKERLLRMVSGSGETRM